MRLSVTINPGVDPMSRGTVEEMVVEAVGGEVELIGGGTLLQDGMLESDFELEIEERSVADVVRICYEIMDAVGFTMRTTNGVTVGDERITFETGGEA